MLSHPTGFRACPILRELPGLPFVYVLPASLAVFVAVAIAVHQGWTANVDEFLLRAFREIGNPSQVNGPPWAAGVWRDLTALGSTVTLTLATLFIAGWFLLRRHRLLAVLVIVTIGGGHLASNGLKTVFERERPDVVPPLTSVDSTSFPSGHAMVSMVACLTFAALMASGVSTPRARIGLTAVAVLVSGAIGTSRVALGVHYPSDVLAGWAGGAAWASAWWRIRFRFVLQAGAGCPATAWPTAGHDRRGIDP